MLVVTRKPEERLWLSISKEDLRRLADAGEDLKMSFLLKSVQGNKASLGCDMPECVRVLRPELGEIP